MGISVLVQSADFYKMSAVESVANEFIGHSSLRGLVIFYNNREAEGLRGSVELKEFDRAFRTIDDRKEIVLEADRVREPLRRTDDLSGTERTAFDLERRDLLTGERR